MSLFQAAQVLNCTKPKQDVQFQGISIDSRNIRPGNLFIAVRGDKFDGHEFINEALQKGAAAILVDHEVETTLPQLIVKDTLEAFGILSKAWRNSFSIPFVGVTGSNGKTTLKNMIAAILRAACDNNQEQVLATEGNLNNNIGVPIMLARLNAKHRYAVIEMGMNHFGEISYLTHLAQPKVAIINNAAEAHLEALKSVAGVAKAKGEIFEGLISDGTAILNKDDAHFDFWLNLVKGKKVLTFGLQNSADVSAEIIEGECLKVKTPKGTVEIKLPLLGKHNAMNALAATAATLALDIPLEVIKQGLENIQPAPGRMRQYHLSNGTRVIDDTYNANPFSLQAAVNTVADLPGKKIVALGDMKELGPDARQIHFECGEKIRAAGIDYLFTYGDMSAEATKAFGKNAEHFTDQQQLISALKPYLKAETTILIKGSRSMHMENVVAGIIPENQLEHLH